MTWDLVILIGVCLLFFIFGYSTGRLMGRADRQRELLALADVVRALQEHHAAFYGRLHEEIERERADAE